MPSSSVERIVLDVVSRAQLFRDPEERKDRIGGTRITGASLLRGLNDTGGRDLNFRLSSASSSICDVFPAKSTRDRDAESFGLVPVVAASTAGSPSVACRFLARDDAAIISELGSEYRCRGCRVFAAETVDRGVLFALVYWIRSGFK